MRPWHAAGSLLLFVAGCGAQYRPVVTPITPTGPASQPTAYFVAISSPSPTAAGLVTIVNAFGDTVVAQATLSNGPFSFNLNASGSSGYNINSDATATNGSGAPVSFVLNSYGITVGTSSGGGLKTQNISTSTIPSNAYPFNAFSTTSSLYLVEPYVNPKTMTYTQNTSSNAPAGSGFIGQLTGTIPALQQEIQVAPNPVNIAGASGAPRIFAISQGSTAGGALATPNTCETNPAAVGTNGEVDSIEVTTNTVTNRIPVGKCPVYGVMSPDYLRAYILNRGSNSITVINSQTDSLDLSPQVPTGTISVGSGNGGPVFADLYSTSNLLVTANYDDNTVSVINVPTDIYQNDGPTFGTVKNIPVGNGPVALTILRDGSRAYVANQNDCTVSVVNLTSFVVTKTISLPFITNAQNQAVACHPKAIASVYSTPAGTVFVASSDSNALTAINTETDTVSASVQLPGNAVTVYSTTQNASNAVNNIVNSNAAGLGVPCASTDTSPFCPVIF